MPGAFDFSDFQNQDSNFGFGNPSPPPAPLTVAPPPMPPEQVDEWGQPVIRQAAPTGAVGPDGVPLESNQEPGGRPICPNDGTRMHKAGFRWSGRSHKIQAYQCPTCGYTTTKKLPTIESPAYA